MVEVVKRGWRRGVVLVVAVVAGVGIGGCASRSAAALPSWNEGETKSSIIEFVEKVTDEGGPGYVAPEDRIAVFDNDGTLWSEQPIYAQFVFAMDRVRSEAADHPEWNTTEPFRSILAGDVQAAMRGGLPAIRALFAETHSGMTTEEFDAIVKEWIAGAKHPVTGRPYTDMVFAPMVELLEYMRANGFTTYIVSGGGIDFMRPWVEEVYGIPPHQVIGSRGKLKFELRDGIPVIVKLPEIDLIDDAAGKPVGIEQVIGRRPIAAFGNSDGDLAMFQWAAINGPGDATPRLAGIVHHTDPQRDVAYDRNSRVGGLSRALDEAGRRGWTVISIKDDWKRIYSFEELPE